MNKEVWKDVVGYEDRYQVSSFGRIRSKDLWLHKSDGKIEFRAGRILKTQKNRHGYPHYLFSKGPNEKRKLMLIHRVVAMAFIPNPFNKPNIDHINTVRDDNRVENLRWCTQHENNLNPITMTKYRKPGQYSHSEETKRKIGLAGLGRKVSEDTRYKHHLRGWPVCMFSKDGVFVKEYLTPIDAEKDIGAAHSHISACCNGKRKSSGGFIWKWKKDWDGNNIEPYHLNKPKKRRSFGFPESWYDKMKKNGEKLSKQVFVYTLDKKLICECKSTKEAAKKFNTDSGSVSRVCNGINKSSKGYIFSYIKYDK